MFKMAAQKHDKLKNAVYANMEKQSSMFERISRANMQFIQVKEDSVATRQREQIVNQINKSVLDFLVRRFSNYTASNSTSDRSLTQIEALLEGHAYGGPRSMVDTALAMMTTNPVALRFAEAFTGGGCLDARVLDPQTTPPAPPIPPAPPVPPSACGTVY